MRYFAPSQLFMSSRVPKQRWSQSRCSERSTGMALNPALAGIVRVAVAVKIIEHHDVDAEIAYGRNPGWLRVQTACFSQLFGERRVEMCSHHLIAGQRLEAVVVRVGQHRVARLGARG